MQCYHQTDTAMVYCSPSSHSIYKHFIISIYDSRKQILPACHCAWWIIKFSSIQDLICQAEFFGVETNL